MPEYRQLIGSAFGIPISTARTWPTSKLCRFEESLDGKIRAECTALKVLPRVITCRVIVNQKPNVR